MLPSHSTPRANGGRQERLMQDFQSSHPGLTGRIFATSSAISSARRIRGYNPLTQQPPQAQAPIKCPRCDSANTKFCYYNNYNLSQPRHFCKSCRRYWTKGGVLRNVPVGGGCRKNSSKRSKSKPDKKNSSGSSSESSPFNPDPPPTPNPNPNPNTAPNPNPNPIFSDAGLMAFSDPGPLPGYGTGGLTGLEWSGAAVDPTSALFDLAGPVDPGLYWGDADPSSLYLP